jgi:type I restriction enzyme S subunit
MSLLIENFDTLLTSPEIVDQIQESILKWGVQGLLDTNDENDESADELLASIQKHKLSLINKGVIRSSRQLPSVRAEEKSHDIPGNWRWTRLGNISEVIGGGTPKTNVPEYWADNEIAWLTPADLSNLNTKMIYSGRRDISRLGLEKSSAKLLPKGSVLFSSRAPIGYVAIVGKELATNQGFKSCFPYMLEINQYIYYFLRFVGKEINKNATGTTFKEVSGKEVKNIPIPLPPLAEQKRIVTKVESLLAQTQAMKEQLIQAEAEQRKLNQSALYHLTSAPSKAEFQKSWFFIKDNFDLLYNHPENVAELKQTILQLAVQGKLVDQDPNDERASTLLERIKAEKAQLVKDGEIRKKKPLPPITEDEIPYDLPIGWEWVRWDEISLHIADVDHKMPSEISEGIPYISPRDFTNDGGIDFDKAKKISEKDYLALSRKIKPESGDIIFPRYGTIGVNRLVDVDFRFLASYSCAIIKHMMGFVNPEYLFYYSLSPLTKNEIEKYINKTTQANVGIKSIQQFLVPLPPLREQNRIVTKTKKMLGMCSELETGLGSGQAEHNRLVEAMLREVG